MIKLVSRSIFHSFRELFTNWFTVAICSWSPVMLHLNFGGNFLELRRKLGENTAAGGKVCI